jgi:hypothetical protein
MNIKDFVDKHSAPESEFAENGYHIKVAERQYPGLTNEPYQYHRNGWAWKNREGATMHVVKLSDSTGKRQNYENFLDKESRCGTKKYQRAHSVGDMFGAESPYGIGYLPSSVNQRQQRLGIEGHLKTQSKQVRDQGHEFYLVVETRFFREKGGFFVKSVHYQAEALSEKGDKQARILACEIAVEDKTVAMDGAKANLSVSQYRADGEKAQMHFNAQDELTKSEGPGLHKLYERHHREPVSLDKNDPPQDKKKAKKSEKNKASERSR